ncbi:uncharacterized protein LOC127809359 [Diospyros lotus]|uniref:uncharacterized protein LOC127809359 n=1 Tax=Diospyros lotus TaxID=55363 RepID=UPI00225A526A|nr:uncharacterized protein LOC127809359 [Diospyros lotus]
MAASFIDASPIPGFPVTITKEQFNLFHAIDRFLYVRLILELARQPAESMHVMALWLWLERNGHYDLVAKMASQHGPLINCLADESVKCLRCTESDQFLFNSGTNLNDIPVLRSVLGRDDISLAFFYENRIGVLRGVSGILDKVCVRAFEDILAEMYGSHPLIHGSPAFVVTGPPSVVASGGGVISAILHGYYDHSFVIGRCGLEEHREFWNKEYDELLSHIYQEVFEEKQQDFVEPDDRTIFLTFSKGYPISENELRLYFTRMYGDIIEAIYMQEVGEQEQVLFSRVVTRSASTMEGIMQHQRKVKFYINGKHVWARKYVRKHHKSPSYPTSSVEAATRSSKP